MSGPVKRRYILAASDASALAHAAADVTNAMVVALCKAESERDELAMAMTAMRAELAEVRAELVEARGSRLSAVLNGCCAFIEQRDAMQARVAALTAEQATHVAMIVALREELKYAAGLRAHLLNLNHTEDSGAHKVTP